MSRQDTIKETITARLCGGWKITEPLFTTSTYERGYDTPYFTMTPFGAPRWVIPVSADTIAEHTIDLDDDLFDAYVDELIFNIVSEVNALSHAKAHLK